MTQMNLAILPSTRNQEKLSVVGFSLFGAWLLSFLFEGQVFYALAEKAEADITRLVLITILVHFIGLFTAGVFIKKQIVAKMTMVTSTVVCIAGSLIFFLPFSLLWYIAMGAMSYFAGLFVASWGFYYKTYSHAGQRLKTAATVLIFSNIIMISINIITVSTTAPLGLVVSIVALLGSLLLTFRLEASPVLSTGQKHPVGLSQGISGILVPMVVLCLFILIFTINSGLMYQAVIPAFAHFGLLTGYFWAIPYIAALLILRSLPGRINKAYILYVALVMLGLSFILFMWLDRSLGSFLVINILMLGALGVADLFWWSILGNMLDYSDNPAQVFGLGLSMNVLGIFIGGVISNNAMAAATDYLTTSIIALTVVFATLIMLPILNAYLTRLLKSHQFLVNFDGIPENKQEHVLDELEENRMLTEKEKEVVRFLLRGYTYKAISQELYITENTMKYHVKNIYQKLHINSKMELVNMFSDKTQ